MVSPALLLQRYDILRTKTNCVKIAGSQFGSPNSLFSFSSKKKRPVVRIKNSLSLFYNWPHLSDVSYLNRMEENNCNGNEKIIEFFFFHFIHLHYLCGYNQEYSLSLQKSQAVPHKSFTWVYRVAKDRFFVSVADSAPPSNNTKL